MEITIARTEDAAEILELQKLAYAQEAHLYENTDLPPFKQTLEEMVEDLQTLTVLKAVIDGEIIGSVRARSDRETCYIGRLVVHPNFQRMGIGSRLVHDIEDLYKHARRYELFTGYLSDNNIRLYQKLGYRQFRQETDPAGIMLVFMEKVKDEHV